MSAPAPAYRLVAAFLILNLTASLVVAAGHAAAQERAISLQRLKSGFEFLGPDLKAMQEDDFANPGMLWVERGEKLWNTPAGTEGKSCASCHGDARASMKGVAARYPAVDAASGRLQTLEARINHSRTERQRAAPWRYDSEELLSISAWIAHQSRGVPIRVSIDGPARARFAAGRDFYYRRSGQLNLSCAHCHELHWGKTLLAERISQGHPNAFPAYRLEWQALGSLERRLRACLSGVRAQMLPYGSPLYADLALFLAWRAQGLPLEAPGVRR
ncbi:MAG: sulfur oxidation c-type cytochrome SoxA [Burkholderiales bacterium]|nr:sulfur oxidation c-type cytochrome SoxA [Burkholderiales bacterium]